VSWAIIRRTWHDSRWLFAAAAIAILFFEPLFIRAISDLDLEVLTRLLKLPFVRTMLATFLGADLSGAISATALASFGFSHPFLFMVTGALVMAECTRTIAGEIDRGSADVWLSLPASRTSLYVSSTLVWLVGGAVYSCMPALGLYIGTRFIQLFEPIEFDRILPLYPNFLLMFVATASLTMCVSAFSTRRMRAISIVFAYLIGSFLLNFLATMWPGIGPVARLSLLRYYEPLLQVRDGTWPTTNLIVLATISIVAWSIGLWRFRTRDIPA
jgi:ABC-type transport system involved in multi-copper enzyme maturation permease subunit